MNKKCWMTGLGLFVVLAAPSFAQDGAKVTTETGTIHRRSTGSKFKRHTVWFTSASGVESYLIGDHGEMLINTPDIPDRLASYFDRKVVVEGKFTFYGPSRVVGAEKIVAIEESQLQGVFHSRFLMDPPTLSMSDGRSVNLRKGSSDLSFRGLAKSQCIVQGQFDSKRATTYVVSSIDCE